jgi:hypothetical protein
MIRTRMQHRVGATASVEQIVERERDPRCRHEEGDDRFDSEGIVEAYGGGLGTEPAGRDRTERVDHGVVERHARHEQADGIGQRDREVDDEKDLGGVGDARGQPGLGEPGHLGSEQTCRSDSEQWRHRHEENYDTYAPEPVGHAAPEEDRWCLGLDIREQRGPRGEPAHRLEARVQ